MCMYSSFPVTEDLACCKHQETLAGFGGIGTLSWVWKDHC